MSEPEDRCQICFIIILTIRINIIVFTHFNYWTLVYENVTMTSSLRNVQKFSYSADVNWILDYVENYFEVGWLRIHLKSPKRNQFDFLNIGGPGLRWIQSVAAPTNCIWWCISIELISFYGIHNMVICTENCPLKRKPSWNWNENNRKYPSDKAIENQMICCRVFKNRKDQNHHQIYS